MRGDRIPKTPLPPVLEQTDDPIVGLNRARVYLKHGHVHINYAVDADGNATFATSSRVCAVCLSGAIYRSNMTDDAKEVAFKAIYKIHPGAIGWFTNDNPTLKETFAVLARARALLKQSHD